MKEDAPPRAKGLSQSLKFDNPELHPRSILRQARNLNTCAHRIRLFKEIGPHHIDLSEFFHNEGVNSAADYRMEAKACHHHHQSGLDVENCLFAFSFNVCGENLPSGIIAPPVGEMQHIAGADGMAVVAVGFGGIGCMNSLARGWHVRSVF